MESKTSKDGRRTQPRMSRGTKSSSIPPSSLSCYHILVNDQNSCSKGSSPESARRCKCSFACGLY